MSAYGTSPVKRLRRTKAQLGELHDAIVAAVEEDAPVSVRGVFYRVMSAGAVEKTERGYAVVQRELLKLRREHRVDYRDITDGSRTTFQRSNTWTGLDEMAASMAASYRRMLWHDQESEVHIFSEKDAITGVVWPVIRKLACRFGYYPGLRLRVVRLESG